MSDDGWLYVVSRDDAKVLFRSKTDEELDAFIADLHSRVGESDHACNCGTQWPAVSRFLADLVPNSPLEQCFLGGRPLYQGDARHVVLTRPDVVPQIATLLKELDDDTINASPDVDLVQSLRTIYDIAAQERSAALFVTQK